MAKNQAADAAAEDSAKIPAQKVKTIDSSEPDVGWTVQHGARPEAPVAPVLTPKDQLATVAGLEEQGIEPTTYLRYFTVDETGANQQADAEVADANAKAAAESAKSWDEVAAQTV